MVRTRSQKASAQEQAQDLSPVEEEYGEDVNEDEEDNTVPEGLEQEALGDSDVKQPNTLSSKDKGKGKVKASTSSGNEEDEVKGKTREEPPHMRSSGYKSSYTERSTQSKASGSGTRTVFTNEDTPSRYARELYRVGEPLESFDIDQEATDISDVRRYFRTTMAIREVMANPILHQRYHEALRLGSRHLGLAIPPQNDYRYLRKTPQKFYREIMILDQIAQGEYLRSSDGRTAYRVPEPYQELSRTLEHIRQLLDRARLLPSLAVPRWGSSERECKLLWSANDYEVLTVCYRKQVEDYLIDTHKYVERSTSDALVLKTGLLSPPPSQYGRQHTRYEDNENMVIHPMDNQSSISQAHAFERSYQRNHERFFGPSATRSRPFSYLSSPLEFAPTVSLTDILSDPPPVETQIQQPQYEYRSARNDPDPGGDPSDHDSDDDYAGGPRAPLNPPPRYPRNPQDPNGPRGNGLGPARPAAREAVAARVPEQARFDLKFKLDAIPEWDGDADTLGAWIIKINTLSRRSAQIYQQLGSLVPMRFKKSAEAWYFSLPNNFRANSEQNWGTLKATIAGYFMNRNWISRQKELAEKARYRQSGHSSETPSEYYIRKTQLLSLVYHLTDVEMIEMIMRGAPDLWTSILTTHLLSNLVEFQAALKFHEESLIRLGNASRDVRFSEQERTPATRERRISFRPQNKLKRRATVHKVGWNTNLSPPSFPKDDKNVSKGKTPEEKGARPCRHCGSAKHWDQDCKYAREGRRKEKEKARTSSLKVTAECRRAQAEYDALYYASASDSEDSSQESEETESEGSNYESALEDSANGNTGQDFLEPSQPSDLQKDSTTHTAVVMKGEAQLRGNSSGKGTEVLQLESKGNINLSTKMERLKNLLTLKSWLSRPPGTSFLGSHATRVKGWLGEYGKNPARIIADSGSDITLISQQALKQMENAPRVKTGEQIALVEVTGTSTITGYVSLPIFLDTENGPVEIKVEAYVVKDMISPFILGNDFADQYSISIIRKDDSTYLELGNSGRRIQVENSIGPSLVNKEGHCFSVACEEGPVTMRIRSQRRAKRERYKNRKALQDQAVRAESSVVIPPESSLKVPVQVSSFSDLDAVYVEKTLYTHRNMEDFYGCADSIISKQKPFLHVSNFSKFPVCIHQGQALGIAHNPKNWLDHNPKSEKDPCVAHAKLIQTLAKTMPKAKMSGDPNPLNSEVVEGGPKTAETPEEPTSSNDIFQVLNLSPDLTPDQREKIKKIVLKNITAFSVDGRLGHYDQTMVEFPMKPDATPVSLPPFGASSPEKRRVIDEQMDAWLKLEVIEPSVSPWGAPAFIVYRQNKPRMVIDYRKLNELIIPDEFPLPRQDDILQTLTGANWLSTLDALAGFTQLQIKPEDREKTAFRTHRGLYQFRRMPFGFRNGPAVFQRVMQGVLAPFLWMFTLVYIDDIVIFSKTFDEHLSHLDQVFKAIAESGITLSPKKCNLGYQSLQLLGQKVSRLGLSTVKEKVDAILQLEKPKNIKELQTFLGMMVYFSSYIPYYAWIVTPLFKLLKKNTPWEWTDSQQEAFELAKEALANSPVRGYAIPGLGYRIYTDACDYGIAAILQQVQPMQIRDLHDTKIYQRLKKAHQKGEQVPRLVVSALKDNSDLPPPDTWATEFEDTTIHVERVIAYWSRTLKPAERNYSPTEREALALKDGLVKFQGFIEGEHTVIAVTDHAALTWARTYQNVNRRLLTWGTIFAAYPNVKIVHRAGRVHSNVDPISRLRRRIPYQEGPTKDGTVPAPIQLSEENPKPEFGELRSDFEAQVLRVAAHHAKSLITAEVQCRQVQTEVELNEVSLNVNSNANPYLISEISADDLKEFTDGYQKDPHYSRVLENMRTEDDAARPAFPQYSLDDDGLIRFDDAFGCSRICVPKSLQLAIMTDIHESPGDAAHGGYHKTYNRIASTFYWPKMGRDIKRFTQSCDICQKVRPRKHAAYGLLQPIPIPTRPFDTITMDFIMELPECEGYNGVLVVVDKLTKYVTFVPIDSTIDAEGTAEIIFKHIIAHYGLPRQIITDRDVRWTSDFWKTACEHLGVRRAFTTAHHPQADGQTEIMNQLLEVALRAYVGPERDDWVKFLDVLQLSYNSSVHSSTKYTPAYLLRGYEPRTAGLHDKGPDPVNREESETNEWIEQLEAARKEASDSLKLAQAFQQRAYNQGRLIEEFEVGEKVLLNAHSLDLLRNVKGKGKKLLTRYEGPFEIMQKVSPLAYRLRMPASYGINPVLNITHLERYKESPEEFGPRAKQPAKRLDFEDLPEYEVEAIVDQGRFKERGRWRTKYLVKFVGYDEPEWLPEKDMINAPDIVHEWKRSRPRPAPHQ